MPATPVGPFQQMRKLVTSFRKEARPEVVDPETLVDKSQPKNWTVLAYLEGRDRLSHSVEVALNGMEEIGSTDSVNVVAQATMVPEFGDRRFQSAGETNTRRYYITQDDDLNHIGSKVVEQMDRQEKLTGKSLEDFMLWGMEKFPANHFMLVVKKHGLGFAANGSSVPLSARELRETLERVEKKTGIKPDVLCWDSCNMEQWEVAYELKDRAKVMTGSPEAIPAVEFPYPTMLHNLVRFPKEQNAQTMGQTVVQSYAAEAPQTTQFALDLEKMDQVGKSIKGFVQSAVAGVPKERLYTNLMKSGSFEPKESLNFAYNFRDMAGFLEQVSQDPQIADAEVKEKAKLALESLQAAQLDRNVSPERAHLKNLSDQVGPSAFLPWKKPSKELLDSYSQLAWAKDTGWDQLLEYTLDQKQAAPHESAKLPGGLGKLALYAYKKYVSPYLLTDCPYDVSCSEYARLSIQNQGLWAGGKSAFMRVVSCTDGAVGGADDPVGCSHSHEHGHEHHHAKLPELTLTPPPSVEKSKLKKRAQNLLFRAARTGGKLVGGVVAGAVGGLAGAAMGAVWGSQAGGGTLDPANEKLRETYGEVKVQALQKLQSPLTNPASRVGAWTESVLGHTVGKAVGQAVGGVMGAGLGLAGGALFSYNFFGNFAGIAAENMTKDALGELPVHYHTEQILRTSYRDEAAS